MARAEPLLSCARSHNPSPCDSHCFHCYLLHTSFQAETARQGLPISTWIVCQAVKVTLA